MPRSDPQRSVAPTVTVVYDSDMTTTTYVHIAEDIAATYRIPLVFALSIVRPIASTHTGVVLGYDNRYTPIDDTVADRIAAEADVAAADMFA